MKAEHGGVSRGSLYKYAAKRYWPLILGLALVGALIGGVLGLGSTEKRTATASVLVYPLDGNPFYPGTRGEQLVNLTTEAEVVRSDSVAKAVIDRLGSTESVSDLLGKVSTNVPTNTQIVQISYISSSPNQATRFADAFAEDFLKVRQARATASTSQIIKETQDLIAKNDAELAPLTAQRASAVTGSPDARILDIRIQALSDENRQLRTQLSAVSSASGDAGQVITPAKLQPSSLVGTKEIYAAVGGALGLLLGLMLPMFWTRARKTFRSVNEIRAFGLDVLARVGARSHGRVAVSSWSPESLRTNGTSWKVRSQLFKVKPKDRHPAILVAGPEPDAGYPSSALLLARSLATQGIKTVIVDATGHIPPPMASSKPVHGLIESLRDGVPPETLLHPLDPHLQILLTGGRPEQVRELIMTRALSEAITSLRQHADVVLVAAPSITSTEAMALAAAVQLVVLEIGLGHTKHADVREAIRICDGLSASVLGAVVVERHEGRRDGDSAEPLSGTPAEASNLHSVRALGPQVRTPVEVSSQVHEG